MHDGECYYDCTCPAHKECWHVKSVRDYVRGVFSVETNNDG